MYLLWLLLYSRYNFISSLSQVQIPLRKLFLPIRKQIPLSKLFLFIAGTTSTPPYRRSQFCCGSCSCDREEPQVQILLRKLILRYGEAEFEHAIGRNIFRSRIGSLPIAGSNSAAEIYPPHSRYNFRSSLSHVQIQLLIFFPYRRYKFRC